MTTMRIGAPNFVEPLWVTTSLGSWLASNPASNIADSDFGNPAISTDATTASTQMALDFSNLATVLGGSPGFNLLMIPAHNLTTAALIRLMIGSAAFTANGAGGGAVQYDSTWIAALPAIVYPPAMLPWGAPGTFTGAANPIMDRAYNRAVVVLLPSTAIGTYGWLGFNDTANPDGCVSLGRVFLGPTWTPSKNFDYGVTIDFAGSRVADETSTNAEFIDPIRKLKRVATFQLNSLSLDEAMAIFLPLQMQMSYAKQGAFVYDPSDAYHMQRRSFMFTLQKPGGISNQYFNIGTLPLALQEVI